MIEDKIVEYAELLMFLIPLGFVGVWRWLIWVFKKSIGLFYRPPAVPEEVDGSLTIITPVYNENPEIFETALLSWHVNGQADEIIAVIDRSDTINVQAFEKFAKTYPYLNAKLIITDKPGKRPALADGIRAATSDFVALVDSDTIWPEPIRNLIMAPFVDPQVGGVGTRQDVYAADSLAKKLFRIHLDNRYFNEMPFLAASGDALTCLSGRTAVYRKAAVLGLVDYLENETFLGQKLVSGDDKTLTRLVQQNGWKTKYVMDAVVYTPGFDKMMPFLKQLVRWNRNSWRSDIETLFSGWAWRRAKMLALHMLDRFVQPFTLLLGPIYFSVALYFGYWEISLAIFIWWMVSRPIKLTGHLRKHPKDIIIIPVYVLFTFISAIIKIYSLVTIYQQGWITRWDRSRIGKVSVFKQAAAYSVSFAVIAGYFVGVSSYRQKVFDTQADGNVSIKPEKVAANIVSSEPREISGGQLAVARASIIGRMAENRYGYYEIRSGDTLLGLQSRYNLSSINVITNVDGTRIGNPNSISIGSRVRIPATELRNVPRAADLLASIPLRRAPLVTYDSISNTIYVKNGGSVVTLSMLKRALGANKALEQTAPGEWILRANLYIGKNVTLVVDGRDTGYLKLSSSDKGHIWILSQSGSILISDTKITSWDETKRAPDLEYERGRSFIVTKGNGRMDVINSEISHLGYEGLPKRGGVFGGSYGLSWKATSGRYGRDLIAGSVIDSDVHDNFFGVYTFGVTGMVVRNNDVYDNIQYGIDPHDDSNNMLIANNRARNNGTHGIILSKRCFNNEISGNVSYDNVLHGIMLHKQSDYNIVTRNTVYGNRDGVAIYEAGNNLIEGNQIYQNKQGVRINESSQRNYIENNRITDNGTGVHIYGDSDRNFLIENSVRDNGIGLSIQEAKDNVIYGSIRSSENGKDGHILVDAEANEIK